MGGLAGAGQFGGGVHHHGGVRLLGADVDDGGIVPLGFLREGCKGKESGNDAEAIFHASKLSPSVSRPVAAIRRRPALIPLVRLRERFATA